MILQCVRSMLDSRPITNWSLENDALIVPFAMPLRLDTIVAGRPLLSTFDAPFATGETAGLRPLPELGIDRWGVIWASVHARSDVRSGHDGLRLLSPSIP